MAVKDDTETVVKEETEMPETPTEETETVEEISDVGEEETSAIEEEIATTEDRIQDILDKHGYDSLDDLEDQFENLKELQSIIGKRDAKKLIEDSEYLEKVKAYWKEQEDLKKREEESYEETADRYKKEIQDLEKQLKDRDKKDAKRKEEKQAQVEADKLIRSFNSTVKSEIDKIQDFPKEYKPFLREFLGVDNPANEIDIGLKPEVRAMAKEGIKKFQDLEQLIIRRYLDGKTSIPKISSTEETPVKKETKIGSLKDARSALFEHFKINR